MKILLIDRQQLVLHSLGNFLSDAGYEVFTASDLKEAADLRNDGAPSVDVIAVDPGEIRDRAERTVEKLNRMYPEADLIVLDRVTLDSKFAYQHGVFSYVRKPVRLAEMELILERIRDKRGGR